MERFSQEPKQPWWCGMSFDPSLEIVVVDCKSMNPQTITASLRVEYAPVTNLGKPAVGWKGREGKERPKADSTR